MFQASLVDYEFPPQHPSPFATLQPNLSRVPSNFEVRRSNVAKCPKIYDSSADDHVGYEEPIGDETGHGDNTRPYMVVTPKLHPKPKILELNSFAVTPFLL